jgi:hypothetical protein
MHAQLMDAQRHGHPLLELIEYSRNPAQGAGI